MVEHKHLIVRAEVKKPIIEVNHAKEWLKILTKIIKMNLVLGPYAAYVEKPNNFGISAVAIIETSHVSLHIWDQVDPPLAQLDVYSCSKFKKEDVFEHLKEMEPTKIEYKFLDRESELKEVELGKWSNTDLPKKN
jgi:S-adenosylmethionine/arginine decarboxylase-like enzyme